MAMVPPYSPRKLKYGLVVLFCILTLADLLLVILHHTKMGPTGPRGFILACRIERLYMSHPGPPFITELNHQDFAGMCANHYTNG